MTVAKHILNIYLKNDFIAQLILLHDEISWQYTDTWKKEGFSISPHLPLHENIPAKNAQRFLRNLLPEGKGLEELVLSIQVSQTNTFGLIRAIGRDLPGALIILPITQSLNEKNFFRKILIKELIERLDTKEESGLTVWDKKPRLSLAGLQDKINIMLNDKSEIGFAEGNLCSTHILKFETKKQLHLVLNEFISMKLAEHCGLNVAEVSLKQFGSHRALLVTRFDREKISDQFVKRRHVIDGCQALNLSPDHKYERNFGSGRDVSGIREGASLPKLFQFAEECKNPAKTKLRLLDWVLFNCMIYNFDAHGKNISFYITAEGIFLAPFYDLVNIAMYPDVEQELAMALGDEFHGDIINAYQLADFAEQCKLSRILLVQRLKHLAEKILEYFKEDSIVLSGKELEYFLAYKEKVTKQSKHLLKEINLIKTIEL